MPVSGDEVATEPGGESTPGYRSHFSHDGEVAQPGYYAVTPSDYGIRAEMRAGTRVGVHRCTFPADGSAHLVMDLRGSIYNYPGKVLWSSIRILADGTVVGERQTRGWALDRRSGRIAQSRTPVGQ